MRRHTLAIASLILLACFMGCQKAAPPAEFVARIGTSLLTEAELQRALNSLPSVADTAYARNQIIEQWVTNELLFQEAVSEGFREDSTVQRLLRENERSVLISALLRELYAESPEEPTEQDIRSYFERNKEQLRLREPFVHLRYLATSARDSVQMMQRVLSRPPANAAADSLWNAFIEAFAINPTEAQALSNSYFPERRLFLTLPQLRLPFSQLKPGEVAVIPESDSLFHVLQLIERVPAGTIPEPEWIAPEIRERLVIQARKQMYARQVQRLRTEALSRNALEERY